MIDTEGLDEHDVRPFLDSDWQELQETAEKFCKALEEFARYKMEDDVYEKLSGLQESVENLIDTELEVKGPDMITVMTF